MTALNSSSLAEQLRVSITRLLPAGEPLSEEQEKRIEALARGEKQELDRLAVHQRNALLLWLVSQEFQLDPTSAQTIQWCDS